MKGHLQKSLRVSAVIATMALGQLSAMAYDSAEEALNYFKSHVITQEYVTGPWSLQGTSASNPAYGAQYDYGIGNGEIDGDSPENVEFKNFYFEGLTLKGSLALDNGIPALSLNIGDRYQINSGFKSAYSERLYEGKYVEIIPVYNQYNSSYSYDEGGFYTDDNGTNWAYIKPSANKASTYTIKFSSNNGTNWSGLRGEGSYVGLIFLIYDSQESTEPIDVKAFIQGDISAANEANATAIDYDKNGNIIRQYKMSFFQNGTSYGFYNLNSKGKSLNIVKGTEDKVYNGESKTSSSNITVVDNAKDWDNQLYFMGKSIPVTVINDSKDFKYDGYKTINNTEAYWFSYTTPNRTELVTVSQKDNTYLTTGQTSENMETFGTYAPDEDGEVNHNHTSTNCPWVDNGGDRKTYSANENIIFYDYGLAYEVASNKDVANYAISKESVEKYYEEYSKTEILWKGANRDHTLEVKLELNAFGVTAAKDLIYVSGVIKPQKNVNFVDHYELCIKADKKNSVTDFPKISSIPQVPDAQAADDSEDLTTDYRFAPNGYPKATNLYNKFNSSSKVKSFRISTSDTEESTSAKDEITFSKYIQTSDLEAIADNATDYSFYIKAVYNDKYYNAELGISQGLSPTYHDVTYFDGVMTGIESVAEEANDATVVGAQGEINVFGDVDNVAVYSISGAQIYNGNAKVIAVPTGIYIVKAGNTVAKVAVP
jgi:hypothetical protein